MFAATTSGQRSRCGSVDNVDDSWTRLCPHPAARAPAPRDLGVTTSGDGSSPPSAPVPRPGPAATGAGDGGTPEQLQTAANTAQYNGGYGLGLELLTHAQTAPMETTTQPRDGGHELVCQMFIKTPTSRTLTLNVGTMGIAVAAVKARIRDTGDIPPDQQRLVLAGKPLLRDERTLDEYGIKVHSTLEVLDRLCGGMPSAKAATDDSAAMETNGAKMPVPAAKPSLTAWAKWVQGPYQTLLRNASFAEQLDTWEIDFLEALTDEGVPEGAVAAMTTRAGLSMDPTEATRAMAAYRGRKHLQPDFVQGVFKKVASAKGDATGAQTSSAPPAPPAVHPSIASGRNGWQCHSPPSLAGPPTPVTWMLGRWTWRSTSWRLTPPTSSSLPSRTGPGLTRTAHSWSGPSVRTQPASTSAPTSRPCSSSPCRSRTSTQHRPTT